MQLLSKELGKLVELHVATHRTENMLRLENCTVHYIDKQLWRLHSARRQFMKILEEAQPDVVHVNSCWEPLCSLTVFWAKRKGYSVILTPHGMLEPWVIARNHWTKKVPAMICYQRRALKKVDALVATSDKEQTDLLKAGYNQSVVLVPNGIDVDGVEIRKSWSPTHTILYMGLLRPNKGAGILLEAAGLIKEHLKGYKLIIAGPDNEGYLASLRKQATLLGLDGIVDFPGGVYGDHKWELYRNADFFVLPTLNENFGIVIAESYLSGTPVITCKGAPWSVISDLSMGWWVDRTAKDVAKAMTDAMKRQPADMEEMGRRGRDYVIKNFSSRIISKRLFDVYEDIIKKNA